MPLISPLMPVPRSYIIGFAVYNIMNVYVRLSHIIKITDLGLLTCTERTNFDNF